MIRGARSGDLGGIESIRRQAPEASGWPAQAEDCLVDESGGRVHAFLVYRRLVDETEILNLAVSPEVRRRGVATALVRHLADMHLGDVLLEVRASNTAARALYRSLGFVEQGLRKGYYRDPVDDALLLRLTPQPHRKVELCTRT